MSDVSLSSFFIVFTEQRPQVSVQSGLTTAEKLLFPEDTFAEIRTFEQNEDPCT